MPDSSSDPLHPSSRVAEPRPQGRIVLDTLPAEEPAARPRGPAQLDEASFEPLADDLIEPIASAPKRARHHRLLTLGGGAVALLGLGEWGRFVWQSWLDSPLWGGAWMAGSALLLLGVGQQVVREAVRLRRLRRRERRREQAQTLLAREGIGQAGALCEEIARDSDVLHSEAYRTFCQLQERSHNDRELLTLYSQQVLAGCDLAAQRRVIKWSAEAAVMVAISPLAVVDMALILWRNLRMIDDIAGVYGIELGYWSRIRLLRQVFRNIVYAGATELVTDVGLDVLGADLAARISARAAQGIGAGLLTARLGLKVMESCRPIPWQREERPKLSSFRAGLLDKVTSVLGGRDQESR